MLIWGSGSEGLRVGAVEERHCANCGLTRPFSLHVHYRYAHLYYLFSWVTRRDYVVACDVCQRGTPIPRSEAEVIAQSDPIPALRRSGWKIGAGILVAMAAFVFLAMPAITANAQRVHVGDVYECAFYPNGEIFGLVRVQAVTDTAVTLARSKLTYPDRLSLHEAFAAKRWRDPGYLDTEHAFQLAPQELEQFLRSGRVFTVWREE